MSVFVWSMVGIAIWHFTILIPDRFAGGIIGAFLVAWLGANGSGFLLEGLVIPSHNPPGLHHVLYALPGSLGGLIVCYAVGSRALAEAQAVETTPSRPARSEPTINRPPRRSPA